MRLLALLALPLLLACSSASSPAVPEDATYRIRFGLLSGDCGGQLPFTARVWKDKAGQHLRDIAYSGPESCRLVERPGVVLGSCPGMTGLEGENTLAIYELGERFVGESYVHYAGACTGRYALTGERM